jgi:hypothetical protein
MSIFLLAFYFVTLSFILSRWKWVRRTHIKTSVLIALFAIKVIAGFGLVYLYGHYYDKSSSDIYNYMNDAFYLKDQFFSDPSSFWNLFLEHNMFAPEMIEKKSHLVYWSSGGVDLLIHEKKTVIILNFLFSFISLGNIYIHSLLMAFIGFIGQVAIFRFAKKQLEINPLLIMLVVFLLPSFTIWSASILKEPLIVFAFGLLLFYVGKWTKQWKRKYLIWALVLFILGLLIKPYVILIAVIPLVFFVLFKALPKLTFKQQSWMVFGSLFTILIMIWGLSKTDLNPIAKLSEKQNSFYQVITDSNVPVESEITIEKLEARFSSLILNLFPAFTRVMFSPYIYDIKKLVYLIDIFQNILILVLAFLVSIKYRKPKSREIPFLWFALIFVFLLFTLIGLVTPVLGAIVRYKIPALPFVFLFLMSFTNQLKFLDRYQNLFFSLKS